MTLDELKHAQRERIIFLDRCFTWRGAANRRDLIERFGISNAQAALDFKLYLERAAGAPPRYHADLKTYLVEKRHKPLFPSSLQDAFETVLGEGGDAPSDMLPGPARFAEPFVISNLYRAMKNGLAIHLQYTSMTSGSDLGQWIAPTVFSSDGEAVHIRAFSYKHREYRDYLPVRISEKSSFQTRRLEAALPFDVEWNTVAKIWLQPKIGLSPEQAEAVRREFNFHGEQLCVSTRKALEYYIERRWGLNLRGARLEKVRTDYEEAVVPFQARMPS